MYNFFVEIPMAFLGITEPTQYIAFIGVLLLIFVIFFRR